jgi:23S rRNA (cytosine1962-C5)-methyltransferase
MCGGVPADLVFRTTSFYVESMIPHAFLDKHVLLKPKEDLRVRNGHPWIFSNEIAQTVGGPGRGDLVEVVSSRKSSLGVGLYNPHSLIAVRLLSSSVLTVDHQFFRRRLTEAATLRERMFPGSPVYRLANGEADFLPGLVIDRFDDLFVVQTYAFGMDQRLPLVCDVLESLFHPAGILQRDESPVRALEDLPTVRRVLQGASHVVDFTLDGVRFQMDPMEGQKSGFFLDQRLNRAAIVPYARGAKVLDGFCNDGGFALYAAMGKAESVTGIDSSAEAIRRAEANARLNGFTTIQFQAADMFQTLADLAAAEQTFDMVVLDPPSFTKSRKNVATAKQGYRQLHRAALRVLARGGILATASCSHHILPEVFLDVIHDAAQREGRSLQLLDWRGASPDHPTLPGVSETQYLKFGILRAV